MRHKGIVISLWMEQHVLTRGRSLSQIWIIREWWTTKCIYNIESWSWTVLATDNHVGTLIWIEYYWAVGYYGNQRAKTKNFMEMGYFCNFSELCTQQYTWSNFASVDFYHVGLVSILKVYIRSYVISMFSTLLNIDNRWHIFIKVYLFHYVRPPDIVFVFCFLYI